MVAAHAFHPQANPQSPPNADLFEPFTCYRSSRGICDGRYDANGRRGTVYSYNRRHWYKSDNPSVKIVLEDISQLRPGQPLTVRGQLQDYDGNPYVPGANQFGVDDPVSGACRIVPVQPDARFTYATDVVPSTTTLYSMLFFVSGPLGIVEIPLDLPIAVDPSSYTYESASEIALGSISTAFDPMTDALVKRLPDGGLAAPLAANLWQSGKSLGLEMTSLAKGGADRWASSPTSALIFAGAAISCPLTFMVPGAQFLAPVCVWTAEYTAQSFIGATTIEASDKIIDVLPLSPTERAYWKNVAIPTAEIAATVITLAPDANTADLLATASELVEYGVQQAEIVNVERQNGSVVGFTIIGKSLSGRTFCYGVTPKEDRVCRIRGYCPVDLAVQDSAGHTVSKGAIGIPRATYTEADFNGDGRLDDEIMIPEASGRYQVRVIPETNAVAIDSFTLAVDDPYFESTLVLAREVKIKNIPPQPYTFEIGSTPWLRKSDLPTGRKNKRAKDGACLAAGDESSCLYALKGNNTLEFYKYYGVSDVWEKKESIPAIGSSGKKKAVKKGAAMTSANGGLFAAKGNNTLEFWRYQASTGWAQAASIPVGGKSVKEGAGAVALSWEDSTYVYFLKGSGTQEFYRFNASSNVWKSIANAPTGRSGKSFKNGSCIAYDGDRTMYALKGSYNEMFAYKLDSNAWTTRAALPLVGRSGKKKKVKDGAGLASLGGLVYALKGGNTQEFWQYRPAADSWSQLVDIPIGGGKKVKGGGALAASGGLIYALKGNNTLEFWRYTPGGEFASAPGSNVATQSVMPFYPFMLCQNAPNPLRDQTAIRYSLPSEAKVSLLIHDVSGRIVRTLVNERQEAGIHSATWNGFADDGQHVTGGVYFYRLQTEKETETRKLIIAR